MIAYTEIWLGTNSAPSGREEQLPEQLTAKSQRCVGVLAVGLAWGRARGACVATNSEQRLLLGQVHLHGIGAASYTVVSYSIFAHRCPCSFAPMSVSLHQISGTFDPGILPRHLAEAVWRGSDLGGSASRAVASGFAELDAQLPGGGWPTHALTEMLTPQAALCEWRLLGPAIGPLLEDGGRIYLIAPPKQPHAAGLVQLGVRLTRSSGLRRRRRWTVSG